MNLYSYFQEQILVGQSNFIFLWMGKMFFVLKFASIGRLDIHVYIVESFHVRRSRSRAGTVSNLLHGLTFH